jgi:hypothetical protein
VKTSYRNDFFRRLYLARVWIIAQFFGIPLLILIGLGWTRLPERHLWQVALSLLLPLLLAAALLVLQAGTIRLLAGNREENSKPVGSVWTSLTLLLWLAIACAVWIFLDWCDVRIPQWAGYLNSRASAHPRARLFTYAHIERWLILAEWALRWVVIPAKLLPYAAASVQWGWRIPWWRIVRILLNWSWWSAILVAALLSVALPPRFFAREPSGTLLSQEWAVGLKLASTYLLAFASWIFLLDWLAVLFNRQQITPADEEINP